jgi:hypothetical protein
MILNDHYMNSVMYSIETIIFPPGSTFPIHILVISLGKDSQTKYPTMKHSIKKSPITQYPITKGQVTKRPITKGTITK